MRKCSFFLSFTFILLLLPIRGYAQVPEWQAAFNRFQSLTLSEKVALSLAVVKKRSQEDQAYFRDHGDEILKVMGLMKLKGSTIEVVQRNITYKISDMNAEDKTFKLDGVLMNTKIPFARVAQALVEGRKVSSSEYSFFIAPAHAQHGMNPDKWMVAIAAEITLETLATSILSKDQ